MGGKAYEENKVFVSCVGIAAFYVASIWGDSCYAGFTDDGEVEKLS